MLTLYYGRGACSMAPHIVLEESGETYEPRPVDLANGEQRTEAYQKVNPRGRVPVLRLDSGEIVVENTAILPYLGKRFKLWPTDPMAETRALSLIGFFAATVHPTFSHVTRPERYATDADMHPHLRELGLKTFLNYLKEIDGLLAGRDWLMGTQYTVVDPYALVFYVWGTRRELPVRDLKNYTALIERMKARPAVQRVIADEKLPI